MRCPEISSQKKKNRSKKYGTYRRKSDSRTIQRFYCKSCQKTYSLALNDPAYNHKKRRINVPLKLVLASCISQHRAALILGVSRRTITRKLIYLSHLCRYMHHECLNPYNGKIRTIQFDERQTIDHTKCKPLSVAVAVSVEDRKIFGVEVSSMPATGYLAAISRRQYGKRPDHRKHGLKRLFSSIAKTLIKEADIYSDAHPYYAPIIKHYFSQARYHQSKGEKSSVSGQGELKKKARDPLFCMNHTCAMLRANIHRLIRKTWCTTKDPARLMDHLAIYVSMHNLVLTPTEC